MSFFYCILCIKLPSPSFFHDSRWLLEFEVKVFSLSKRKGKWSKTQTVSIFHVSSTLKKFYKSVSICVFIIYLWNANYCLWYRNSICLDLVNVEISDTQHQSVYLWILEVEVTWTWMTSEIFNASVLSPVKHFLVSWDFWTSTLLKFLKKYSKWSNVILNIVVFKCLLEFLRHFHR